MHYDFGMVRNVETIVNGSSCYDIARSLGLIYDGVDHVFPYTEVGKDCI